MQVALCVYSSCVKLYVRIEHRYARKIKDDWYDIAHNTKIGIFFAQKYSKNSLHFGNYILL